MNNILDYILLLCIVLFIFLDLKKFKNKKQKISIQENLYTKYPSWDSSQAPYYE